MIRLSVAIQHHPLRSERIPPLLARLGAWDPPIQVVADHGSQGVWPTYQRCLRAADPEATHHLVLQDDVIPCRDMLAGAVQALMVKPDALVSFFGTRRSIKKALATDRAWVQTASPLMGQAFCWPTALIPAFLAWADAHIDPAYDLRWEDCRVAMWLMWTDRAMWHTAPSLVEHGGYAESLIGVGGSVGGRPRVAAAFLGADVSALTVDWTRGADRPIKDYDGISRSAYAPYVHGV